MLSTLRAGNASGLQAALGVVAVRRLGTAPTGRNGTGAVATVSLRYVRFQEGGSGSSLSPPRGGVDFWRRGFATEAVSAGRPAADAGASSGGGGGSSAGGGGSGSLVPPPKRKKTFSGGKVALGSFAGAIAGLSAYVSHYNKQDEAHIRRVIAETRELRAIPSREENLEAMRRDGGDASDFDVLVIGGGATGCGVALDAVTRGLSVACVEAEDFSSGASSKSTKLLWAGSRYLVLALVKLFNPVNLASDFFGTIKTFKETWHMVMGCHTERRFMLGMNQHLTNWVPIAVPHDAWFMWPPPFGYYPAALGPISGMFPAFFKFYDMMGMFCSPASYIMTPGRAYTSFPQLRGREGKDLKYATVFYEGQHNDSRTNIAVGLTASLRGAKISNYTEAVKFHYDPATGRANGATLRDRLSGEQFDVKAKQIIFAAGPYTDGVRRLTDEYRADAPEGEEKIKKAVKGAGGTHIVLPGYYTPKDMGMVDMTVGDGRFLFILPWLGHTLVGTTDSKANTSRHGIRPLAIDPHAASTAGASRDHVIAQNPNNGIFFIAGGKWTTYREMAEDVMNKVVA
eukprot:gene367-280_t